jgi:Transglutaminase-like superfamily
LGKKKSRISQSHCVVDYFPQNQLDFAVAGRYVSGTTCLSLALAGRMILNRYGYTAHIHIGVAKDHTVSFGAHAWLESEGTIVIGGQESTSLFAPLGVIGEGNSL